jgi:cytochrome c-type biogenesis protein CcmH
MSGLPRAWLVAAAGAAAAVALIAVVLWTVPGMRAPGAAKSAMPGPPPAAPAADPKGAPSPGSVPGLDVMAQRLASRLESTGGNDGAGWELLARSYVELRRHADAVKAFERARKLRGDGDAQLLADYADALAVANGKRFDAAVRELVAAALKADPANAKAIELDASVAYADRDYRRAIAQWEKLLAKSDPSSDHGRVLAANIAEARAQGGMAPTAAPSWMPETLKGQKATGR